MRVIISGSNKFRDNELLYSVMDTLLSIGTDFENVIVDPENNTGRMGMSWAKSHRIKVVMFDIEQAKTMVDYAIEYGDGGLVLFGQSNQHNLKDEAIASKLTIHEVGV